MTISDEQLTKELILKIQKFEIKNISFHRRKFIHIFFAITGLVLSVIGFNSLICYILMIIALYMFVHRLNMKHKLKNEREDLNIGLDEIRENLTLDKYFELKKMIINTGR